MCENQANYGLNMTFAAIPTQKKKRAVFLYIFLCTLLHMIFFCTSYVIKETGKCFLLCSTKEL